MTTAVNHLSSATLDQDRTALIRISERLVEACPDMREMARSIAREILLRQIGHDAEPDTVYWHRFHTAVSSPRSFNGWQHRDAPYQSMSLPQLVMHRFTPHDQDNADTLQMLSGFYTADADADAFDERNEVRMLPAQVMGEFWSVDFKSRYHEKLKAFWRDFADHFRTMAKANFIASALEDHQAGWLTEEDLRSVLRAANVEPPESPSLETLQASAPASAEASVWTFDVIGYEASDILRVVTAGGRQILYTPGEVQAFHAFATPEELHWWLLSQNNRTERRARFMGHFPLSAHGEADDNIGLFHGLDVLYTTWGAAHPGVINQHSKPVSGDPFSHLRDSTRTRMLADADLALHSNGDLRKQMWIGYLRSFSQLSGALAAIDWPIALAAVGAGIADMGLNIDQALNGASTAQRKAGVIGAVAASIDVLFNSTFLVGGEAISEGELLRPEPEGEPVPEVDEPIDVFVDTPGFEPESVYPFERNDGLASFETNMLLDAFEPIREEGRMKGICLTDQGETFIEVDGFAYAVRYINELKSWAIIDPENPFSFYRNMPVSLNAAGAWEPVTPLGLSGGGKVLGRMWPGRGVGVSPQTTTLPSPYEIPDALKSEVMDGAQYGGRFVDDRYRSPDFDKPDPYDEFKRIRRNLRDDANTFFNTLELPKRPEIPELPANAPLKSALKSLFKRSSGLVIGESHAGIGSKQFLIEQMPLLAKLKVKTLYMEHMLTDFHQADLDAFSRTGTLSSQLEEYIKTLDKGHRTDPTGKYTFMAVLKSAQENRVRIRAIDCMASYRVDGMEGAEQTLRQKVMNYYAKGVIDADQGARSDGNWVALVGNSHANTYQGVPGIAELEGVVGLRIEDVRLAESAGITSDPGIETTDTVGRRAGRVQSDLRLQVLVAAPRIELSLENKLLRAGMFTLDDSDGQLTLVHRSNEGLAVRTEIKREGKRVFIDRPKWQRVSGRRFDTLGDLTSALELMGMTWVR
ncbi:membrane-targeted effector domain-containing toxin [Pseudomonas sp. CFBP 13711]|uniref:membrane-targeted effector domain-containing toxin n=1 Tax=unclassified Pseudomonas TaxID=196821 RepID=UPI00178386B3|nr:MULTISPECIES: membrane-targeted effector domain-containing toxin [unclassified Pseudomonas]MBD8705820.1 membrane-targeted effector domain-containing toxin [Pseudomonas sp. CFBP 13711]MBD8710481.1 membrane-targeted effector domain-containing toxin [Pseudomonas sp. CFBP 13715]